GFSYFPLVLVFFLPLASPLKFLCYSPRFAASHVNYLGKLADSLIDAGHEVVILSQILDSRLKSGGSDRARVIEIPQDEIGQEYERATGEDTRAAWYSGETWQALDSWASGFDHWVAQCNTTINYPGLLQQLRDEKFDAAFGESLNWCIGGLFHLVGIKKFALTESIAYKDGMFALTQVPTASAYVPSIMGGSFGDEMTFFQRAFNVFNTFMYARYNFGSAPKHQKMFDSNHPGFPDVVELMAENSLIFLNSDPLVDFPRPSAARIIDIGGIYASNGHDELNKEWSAILDLRTKTVFMSFGTFARAFAMPEEYKNTIRETAKAFLDVTFIWKYEKPEHNVTQGIPNLIETTWAPQHDLLNDPRLSVFVTHCGAGSTTEANYAGVPLLVVPVTFDQIRNAFAVKRNGLGINLDKSDLGRPVVFQNALREVLENQKYKNQAMATAAILNDKPFTAREIFVRNMEFLAKHGPLRQLDHYGRHLNIFQYYLIDIIAVIVITLATIVSLFIIIIVKLMSCAKGLFKVKTKKE
ncbi:hypothetical protein PENTCL1PPCAC_1069, partial [Pristionchus entomophagus]